MEIALMIFMRLMRGGAGAVPDHIDSV